MQNCETIKQELGMPMKIIPGLQELGVPMKVVPASEAPSDVEYVVGEEVLALRSNGSWSPGVIAEIQQGSLTVHLQDGVKKIKKEMAGSLLTKSQSPQAMLASQKMALELENAWLAFENMQMHAMCMPYDISQEVANYEASPYYTSQAACVPTCEVGSEKPAWTGKKKKRTTSSTSTNSGRSSATSIISCAGDAEAEIGNVADERTTVMMCNIPNNLSRTRLLMLVDEEGFEGCYNLAYLPVDLKHKVGLGYAFMNFVTHEAAEAFAQHFDGFQKWGMASEKRCAVKWSDVLQGLDDHVARYRDCPVMHESVADEFKPVLYKDGVRIPFPEPTKKIRAPRPWSRRQ